MHFMRYWCLTGAALALLLGACNRQGQDEMSWARTALERNGQIEIVAADPQSRTFTVRVKDTGELRMVRADELIAGPAGTLAPQAAQSAAPPAAARAAQESAGAPAAQSAQSAVPVASPGEAAAPANAPEPQSASLIPQNSTGQDSGGRVLSQGPGYSIKAAAPTTSAAAGRARDTNITSAAVERRHEPIVCQGSRMLHIDNRNLEFDGDAVSAEDGCEIHITNSHISATGVGVTARAANVHIDNSLIEGGTACIDASEGAQIYTASSRFRGLSRRLDTASVHDLGGNIWN
jgi:hypothetical protein